MWLAPSDRSPDNRGKKKETAFGLLALTLTGKFSLAVAVRTSFLRTPR